MSKLPIFEHFLSVGKSQAKTQVVFQAEIQAKNFLLNWAPGLGEHHRHDLGRQDASEVGQTVSSVLGEERRIGSQLAPRVRHVYTELNESTGPRLRDPASDRGGELTQHRALSFAEVCISNRDAQKGWTEGA